MVRVWYNAYDDEEFIDQMANHEFIFSTEAEALEFKKAFNEKFWNHGGWEFHYHKYGQSPVFTPGSPAEGPYEQEPEILSVEASLNLAYTEANLWGMEEEE